MPQYLIQYQLILIKILVIIKNLTYKYKQNRETSSHSLNFNLKQSQAECIIKKDMLMLIFGQKGRKLAKAMMSRASLNDNYNFGNTRLTHQKDNGVCSINKFSDARAIHQLIQDKQGSSSMNTKVCQRRTQQKTNQCCKQCYLLCNGYPCIMKNKIITNFINKAKIRYNKEFLSNFSVQALTNKVTYHISSQNRSQKTKSLSLAGCDSIRANYSQTNLKMNSIANRKDQGDFKDKEQKGVDDISNSQLKQNNFYSQHEIENKILQCLYKISQFIITRSPHQTRCINKINQNKNRASREKASGDSAAIHEGKTNQTDILDLQQFQNSRKNNSNNQKLQQIYAQLQNLLKSNQMSKFLSQLAKTSISKDKSNVKGELQDQVLAFFMRIINYCKNLAFSFMDEIRFKGYLLSINQILLKHTDIKARVVKIAEKIDAQIKKQNQNNKSIHEKILKTPPESSGVETEKSNNFRIINSQSKSGYIENKQVKNDQLIPQQKHQILAGLRHKVCLIQLSVLINNLHVFLPSSHIDNLLNVSTKQVPGKSNKYYSSLILQLFCQNFDSLSENIIFAFMVDSISYDFKFSSSFLQTIYCLFRNEEAKLKQCYRYIYLCFIQKYMEVQKISEAMDSMHKNKQVGQIGQSQAQKQLIQVGYTPLFSTNLINKKKSTLFDSQAAYRSIKLIAKQYEVGYKCASRSWIKVYNKKVSNLSLAVSLKQKQKQVFYKKLSLLKIIKWYNVLAQTYPMGIMLLKDIIVDSNLNLFYDIQAGSDDTFIDEMEKLICNLLKNLKTQYVYSINEHSANQINKNIINMLFLFSNKIIKQRHQFLLQITDLLAYYNIYQGTNTKAMKNNGIIVANDNNMAQNSTKQQKLHQQSVESTYSPIIQQLISKYGLNTKEAIQAIFGNQELTNDIKLLKLVDFICKNIQHLQINSNLLIEVAQNILNVSQFNSKKIEVWKFLYQVCSIISHDKIPNSHWQKCSKIKTQLYYKFCDPYIKANQQNKQSTLIRQPKLHEQYILRIAYLYLFTKSSDSNLPTFNKQSQINLENSTQMKQLNNAKNNAIDQITIKELVNFINSNFIFTAKSVLKKGLIQIILFLDDLSIQTRKTTIKNQKYLPKPWSIDPEIYSYLYANLSSFILYNQTNQNFWLIRGKDLFYERNLIKIVKNSLNNWESLRHIENKNRLNSLFTLCGVYWNTLDRKSVAKLLMIVDNPTQLTSKLKHKVSSVLFKCEDFQSLDLKVLSKFRFINESLAHTVQMLSPSLLSSHDPSIKLKLSNKLSSQQIQNLFHNHYFYEEAITKKDFQKECKIPIPETDDSKIKTIYACLRIVHKIRQSGRDYSLKSFLMKAEKAHDAKQNKQQIPINSSEKSISSGLHKPLNLQQQLRYVRDHNLTKLDSLNEFKLNNINITGHNQIFQGWALHQISDNTLIQLQQYAPYGQDSSIYEKTILAVFGNSGLIKRLTKNQHANSELLKSLQSFPMLNSYMNGSLTQINTTQAILDQQKKYLNSQPQQQLQVIQSQVQKLIDPSIPLINTTKDFGKKKPKSQQLYVFSSTQKNYKLHMIYAYILQQLGYNVIQISHKEDRNQIIKALVKYFNIMNGDSKLFMEIIKGGRSIQNRELTYPDDANEYELQKYANSGAKMGSKFPTRKSKARHPSGHPGHHKYDQKAFNKKVQSVLAKRKN